MTKTRAKRIRLQLAGYRRRIVGVSIGMADDVDQPVDISRQIDEAAESIELAICKLDEFIENEAVGCTAEEAA